MKSPLLSAFLAFLGWNGCPSPSLPPQRIDFSEPAHQNWLPLNDNVMGGVSRGAIAWSERGMMWEGETRLENNGGFSSVRSPWTEVDLSKVRSVTVRCRGTGGPYKLVFETSSRWYFPYAFASFSPSEDWNDIAIPLSSFSWSQAFTGDWDRSAASLERVLRMGLMKYDGTATGFSLEVASIAFD